MLLAIGLLLVMFPAEPGSIWPAERPGLYITVYDWAKGGQNCDWVNGAPECGHTSLTTTGPELYGWTGGCPVEWLGHIATTVVTIWGVEIWCIDTFGRPEDRVLTRIHGRLVYRIDLAFRPAAEHHWNQEYVPAEDWSRERRWMTEFYELREKRADEIGIGR